MLPVLNNAASVLRSAYAPGDGVLKLRPGDGVRFGTAFPIRVTVQSPSGGPLTIFRVSARAVDDLSVSGVDEATVDQPHPTGSAVENRWTAGAVAELAPLSNANNFTAAQTIHAHAAIGVGAAIDPPNVLPSFPDSRAVLNLSEEVTDTATANKFRAGLCTVLVVNPAGAGPADYHFGAWAEVFSKTGNAAPIKVLHAIGARAHHEGSAAITNVYGLDVGVSDTSAGAITRMYGLDVQIAHSGTGIVGSMRGARLQAPTGTGPITSGVGLEIGDWTGKGTTEAYNIHSLGVTSRNAFQGTVRVGLNPVDGSAVLDCQSTTKGALMPRMTTAQRNAIATPAEGLIVYDISLHALCFRRAADWLVIGGAPGVLEAEEATEQHRTGRRRGRGRRVDEEGETEG